MVAEAKNKSASSDADFSGDAVDGIISEEREEFMSAVFVQVENSSESDISLDMRACARARPKRRLKFIPSLYKRTQFDQLAIVTLSFDSGERHGTPRDRDPFEKGGGTHTRFCSPLGRHTEQKRCQTDTNGGGGTKIVIAAFHASECRSISRSSAGGTVADAAAVLS